MQAPKRIFPGRHLTARPQSAWIVLLKRGALTTTSAVPYFLPCSLRSPPLCYCLRWHYRDSQSTGHDGKGVGQQADRTVRDSQEASHYDLWSLGRFWALTRGRQGSTRCEHAQFRFGFALPNVQRNQLVLSQPIRIYQHIPTQHHVLITIHRSRIAQPVSRIVLPTKFQQHYCKCNSFRNCCQQHYRLIAMYR